MAQIRPFRGIVYNQEKVGSLKGVVAPPYDVISEKMQNYFYGLSPYNIIRIILGKENVGDTKKLNKYTRAKDLLNDWIKNSILVKDKKPSIYVYRQTYLHRGRKRVRIGFIALMKIEDPHKSRVLPHEYTLDKPKIGRLKLIKSVKANLSPIFSLYYDRKLNISKFLKKFIRKNPSVASLDLEGVIHQLWILQDSRSISSLKKHMREKKIFIADGHHRYEVALMYRDIMRRRKSYNKMVDYVMMYFTNLYQSDNVTILSTHRLFKDIGSLNKKRMLELLENYFEITSFRSLDRFLSAVASERKKPCFGIYLGGKIYFLIVLRREVSIPKIIKCEGSNCFKRLDVTVLHNFILKDLFALKDTEDNIKYVRDPNHVVKLVDGRKYKLAFFLNPTKVHQVKEVAESGDMMPQKSTYFYPKLLSGLVINKF